MPSTGIMRVSTATSYIRFCLPLLALLLGLAVMGGCSLVPDVKHKPQYINPFPQLKSIAVLPFANQSEEPTLSGERVALAYINELQSIRGFEVLPLGAVKVKLSEYTGPLSSGEHFQQFAQYLGVDAVIIGSVTDFDAYYPPRMTMAVRWYAANPGFHPVLPGYGLPWGTKAEKEIPSWIHDEAQRALAAEQLKSQTPRWQEPQMPMQPIMPEDRSPSSAGPNASMNSTEELPPQPPGVSSASATSISDSEQVVNSQWTDFMDGQEHNDSLPPEWPDPRGFIPDPPSRNRPDYAPQSEPIISHMRNFNGRDEDFTQQLEEYFYFQDDARFGGWQAYLQRSEDFIRFCCYLHLTETLALRGGQDETRLILRWPIDRYTR